MSNRNPDRPLPPKPVMPSGCTCTVNFDGTRWFIITNALCGASH